MDVARTEQIEVELDSFIAKRDKQRRQTEGERAREQLWQESVRRYYARCGEQKRLERLHHHEGQAKRLSNTLGSLVAYHEAEVEKYRGGR